MNKKPKNAVKNTIMTLGLATLMTSVTTAIGFLVLYSSNVLPMRKFGIFSAIGIISAFIISITFLSLMLIHVKSPVRKQTNSKYHTLVERLIKHVIYTTTYKPKQILLIGFGIVVVMGFGITKVKMDSYLFDDLSPKSQIMKDLTFFEKEVTGIASIEILIADKYEGAALTPEMLSVTDDIENFLFQFPEVISVISPSKVIKRLNQSIHNDSLEYYLIPESKELIAQYLLLASSAGKDPLEHYINFEETTSRVTARIKNVGSNRVKHILDDLDVFLSQNTLDKFEVKTTGTTKLVQSVNNQISISLTSSLVLAIGIIALLMGLLFRSFRFMLISMIPNILPLILIAGTMGWLGIRLRLATAAVFCVAFGIAVDDTIHFLSRVKLEMREGSSLEDATQKSLVHTGKAIIATSIVLIAGFSVLLSSKFQSSFDFGLLTALTIFFALVSDLYLLPIMINRFGYKLDKTVKNKN